MTMFGKALVGMAEVEAAIQEMFQVPHIQVMKTCSKLSKIYLTAMVYELYKTGMGEITFEKLEMTVYNLCTSNGEAFPGHDTLLKVGCKLGECRFILCESGVKHRLQKLQLNFPRFVLIRLVTAGHPYFSSCIAVVKYYVIKSLL
ncbi:hypothetical protein ACLB2K_002251 [Fragaria x ananassa]